MNSDGKVAVSTAIDGGSRGDDKPRMTRRQRKSEAKKQRKAREFAQAQDRCEYYTDARGMCVWSAPPSLPKVASNFTYTVISTVVLVRRVVLVGV